jgi:hypothetical protein
MGNQDSAQREIDEAFFEVSEELSEEELGGRRRSVWIRNRLVRTEQDLDLGKPGYADRPWEIIYPTPHSADTRRDFEIDQVGLVRKGDLELRVDRLSVSREILTESEFYISDDPDADPPISETQPNYDLIGGYVLEGGSGIRERFRSFWTCFLRRRQMVNG